MIVRTVGPGGQTVPGPGQPQGQRVVMTTQGQQIIRTATGQMVMTSGGQRIVGPGGQVLMARPQGQQIQQGVQLGQQIQQGQQIVRTSSGQILVQQGGGMAQQRGQVLQQQGQVVGGQPAAIRQQMPQVPANQAGIQRVVINQPGIRPGQPGAQITVPLSTLQGLQAGQGIPTGQPGHLLVKTETGQYQILRVGPPGQQPTASSAAPQQPAPPQPQPTMMRPTPVAVSSVPTAIRSSAAPVMNQIRQPTAPTVPTRPVIQATTTSATATNSSSYVQQPQTSVSAPTPASAAGSSMGQQMTPDTAKIKCKNFLATLLRLASDQPEAVARNVRALIQGLIDGRVEPEVFTTKLQKELNSSPQPCLVPFLKKSLPYLQHSLATRELTIDGVNPPSLSQVGKLPPATGTVSTSLASQPTAPVRPLQGNTFVRPAPVASPARPTFVRPALPTRPVQINTGTRSLMPPPASAPV